MEITRLPAGERAPSDSDCISIDEQPDGRFSWIGSLLTDEESEAIVDPIICDTRENAEDQGIAWADGCGVKELVISTTLVK